MIIITITINKYLKKTYTDTKSINMTVPAGIHYLKNSYENDSVIQKRQCKIMYLE